MREYELIIIGAGAAGLSAAIAAKEQGIESVIVLDRLSKAGGILPQCLHRGFGKGSYGCELTGTEFIEKLLANTTGLNIDTDCTVLKINPDRTVLVTGSGGYRKLRGKCIVLASGCRERPIGHLPVYGTRPAGVLTAGSAQRMINLSGYKIGRRAVILGSGDVGMIVAHHLSQSGTEVVGVIEKGRTIGGLPRNKKLYLDTNKIPVITEATITELQGTRRLISVEVCKLDEKENPILKSEYRIECDTLITSVGLIPELELICELPIAISGGCLESSKPVKTELPWLFVCGNARKVHSLIDSVVYQGRQAGIAAAEFLQSSKS